MGTKEIIVKNEKEKEMGKNQFQHHLGYPFFFSHKQYLDQLFLI